MSETIQKPVASGPDPLYGLRNQLRCELRKELAADDSLLSQARRIIAERRQQHGQPGPHFAAVAGVWSILLGHEVTAHQVCLCMATCKIIREAHQHHSDNLIDLVGYADCMAEILKGPQ